MPTQRKPKPATRAKERNGACKLRKPQARKNRPLQRVTSASGGLPEMERQGATSRTCRSSTYISAPSHVEGLRAPERIRGEEIRHHGRFSWAQQRVDQLKVAEGRAEPLAESVPRLDPVATLARRRTAHCGGMVMKRLPPLSKLPWSALGTTRNDRRWD